MSNNRLKEALGVGDRRILDASDTTNWIPDEPQELILPYIEQAPEDQDRTSAEARREKAQEVYDKYGAVIETCQRLEDEITERCKEVRIPLNPQEHANTIAALKRTFGISDATEITFDMYKLVVHAIAAMSNQSLPQINPRGD